MLRSGTYRIDERLDVGLRIERTDARAQGSGGEGAQPSMGRRGAVEAGTNADAALAIDAERTIAAQIHVPLRITLGERSSEEVLTSHP